MAQSRTRRKGATRADVAARAGVSPATVSVALNGQASDVGLAAATVQRIKDAAAALNYTPNATARALSTRRSTTVGLILNRPQGGPHAPVFSDLMLSAVDAARQSGHFILLMTDAGAEDLDQQLRTADIGGLVAQYGNQRASIAAAAERRGIPLVWVDPAETSAEAEELCVVRPRHQPGMAALAAHLASVGCRSVQVLDGPGSGYPESPRYATLRAHFDGRVDHLSADGWSSEDGRSAMRRLLAGRRRPTTIFAGNDHLAAGALQACREAALAVPDDIRIAGFGNFPIAEQLDPTLTTVDWPLTEVAQRAVELVIGELAGSAPVSDQVVEVDTSLFVRRSA
ncbi:LacI family DNA-binding transcriptional regulator [Microlunatus soli]|uniref:LacI family transcriptional regulator n=1 Tax=Microlunatus soli TaxID=630515 RepID=A0A1H1U4C0_9ACTN|nr:LacI family DNA-binding transcriptional regulator [Microlunatus soli]SDS67372.1 LacI family transcriptional regulator [Microlunatus soli]